jgi:hypothetical protein
MGKYDVMRFQVVGYRCVGKTAGGKGRLVVKPDWGIRLCLGFFHD